MKPMWEGMVGELVTSDDGKTVHRVVGYCQSPTVTIQNLETKEKLTFGINGLLAEIYKRLVVEKNP